MKIAAYAALRADTPLAPFTLSRREPGANDVVLDILYCGVCHSDQAYERLLKGDVKHPFVIDIASLKVGRT